MLLNKSKPCFAVSEIAFSSPATQRSNGATPLTTVRSKVAIALAMFSTVTPSPGKLTLNSVPYSGIDFSSETMLSMFWFFSTGADIGPSACSSSVSNRPSHMSCSDQARFRIVGVWRPKRVIAWPIHFGKPSPQEKLWLWQVAQEM